MLSLYLQYVVARAVLVFTFHVRQCNMYFSSLIFILCGLNVFYFHGAASDTTTEAKNACQNYVTIRDVRRSTAYVYNLTSGDKAICDSGYIKDDTWYRFQSVAGNKMPTTNPGNFRCGTYAPIWMKGTHPTASNVIVNAKACASIPFVSPPGCGVSYDIKVVKCTTFYIYQLKDPGQCDLAYCAGRFVRKGKKI